MAKSSLLWHRIYSFYYNIKPTFIINHDNEKQGRSNADLIPEEDKQANDRGMNESIDHHEGQTENGELGGNFGKEESATESAQAEENINTSHA